MKNTAKTYTRATITTRTLKATVEAAALELTTFIRQGPDVSLMLSNCDSFIHLSRAVENVVLKETPTKAELVALYTTVADATDSVLARIDAAEKHFAAKVAAEKKLTEEADDILDAELDADELAAVVTTEVAALVASNPTLTGDDVDALADLLRANGFDVVMRNN
jgi:hypothetical protein